MQARIAGRLWYGVAAMLVALALLASPASATAPTLAPLTLKISDTERSVTAQWTLPEGMSNYLVEAARAPETYPDGSLQGQFPPANLSLWQLLLGKGQTTWQLPLGPGRHWVHVGAYDGSCASPYDPACVKEFSAMQTIDVPPASPPGLIGVGHQARRLTASWWRSPWHVTDFIEVATTPEVYDSGPFEGEFLEENTILYDDEFYAGATEYLSGVQLSPGTHYVHVATHDVGACPTPENCKRYFSPPLPVTIPRGPPVLNSVTHDEGYLRASWSLPSDMLSNFIEVATSPAVYPDGPLEGLFLDEHLVFVDDTIGVFQKNYLSDEPLPNGIYYVHVAAFAPLSCPSFDAPTCVNELSGIRRVAIPSDAFFATPSPPPPPPRAPAAKRDTATAFASLSAPKAASARRLVVRAAMAEPGTITVNGTVSVPGAARAYRLKTVSKQAAAGAEVKLRLKPSAKVMKAIRRALRRGQAVRAKITVTARDLHGNAVSQKRTIKLRR